MPARIIMHVDMDAFFAAIEELDFPELKGKPVIVGGGVARGVVSTANYAARTFGVRSAMPMAQALRRCPQAIVRPVRGKRYRAVSRRVMEILGRLTPLLEQVSVDEAYLDLTHWLPVETTAESAARAAQEEIFAATGLTCSIGLAGGKAVAKIASDLRKPNGLVVVPPGGEAAFLAPLPIGKLRGVGTATEKRLRALGVRTIGELANLAPELLVARFGAAGHDLHALATGHDDSPVVPERQAKSLGREITFPVDISDRDLLERTLLELAEDVAESLRRHGLLAKGATLKLRYGDFETLTRAHAFPEPTELSAPLYQAAIALFNAAKTTRPIRLIGITAAPLLPAADRQLSLFAEPDVKGRKLASAVDAIRGRFGDGAIKPARLAEEKKTEAPRKDAR